MEYMSSKINELATALCKVQSSTLLAKKDGKNPHFKSKYATLPELWECCRQALTENGLCVSQVIAKDGDKSVLISLLLHTSGQWIKSTMELLPIKPGPQEMGSLITYMRRYAFAGLLGIAPGDSTDDDGEKAEKSFREAAKKQPPKEDAYYKLSKMVKDFALDQSRLEEFIELECERFNCDVPTLVNGALQTPDIFLKNYSDWLKVENEKE